MKPGQIIFMLLCSLCGNVHAQLKSFACGIVSEGSPEIMVTQQVAGPSAQWLYRAGFESPSWSGSLKKYPLRSASSGITAIGAALWDAADQWPGVDGVSATGRKIWTRDSTSGKTIEFLWENLTEQQKKRLNEAPGGARPDGFGEQRVSYLRGQRDAELGNGTGIFRPRKSVLGGILNSTPVLANHPPDASANSLDGNRRETIYVGANDGMLHAFAAADGKELFAYVPEFLLPELGSSTSSAATPRSWFDGKLALQDVGPSGASKTILAAAAGTGAKGVVALDVSRPDQFGNGSGVLWEFSDADDPEMGYVTGSPSIATFQVRPGERRNFVVVSSGQASAGLAGPGRLFLLALDKPAGVRWQRDTNYFKLATGAEGLGAAALVPDENGTVAFAYAGDLGGTLWRFDFSGAVPWPAATHLFSAMDARGNAQPIVAKPSVVFAPGSGYLILFGTGRLLATEEGLATRRKPQSLYAVHDMAKTGQPAIVRSAMVARAARQSGKDTYLIDGASFSYGAGASDRKGWYLDFPDAMHTGERQVDPALADSGLMVFRSLIPAADGCDRGDGRNYFLDPLTGLPASGAVVTRTSTGGQVAPVMLSSFDRPASGATGGAILSRRITVLVPAFGKQSVAAAPVSQGAVIGMPVQRLGWHEVSNWPDGWRAGAPR